MKIIDLGMAVWSEKSSLHEKMILAGNVIEKLSAKIIVIYGAGAVGHSLLESLQRHKITPAVFIDKEYETIKTVNGIAVKSPESLAEFDADTSLLIIAINAEVIRRVKDSVYENIDRYNPNLTVVEDGAELVYAMNFSYCNQALQRGESLDLVHCLNCSAETKHCDIYENYLREIAILPSKKITEPSKKFDWFGYIMGQYCTLKCKHCCEHVPYMKNPVFVKKETIIEDCKKVAEACDFLRYIELIGGEPFLHPNFVNVLKELLEIKNVGYIKTFTNGTVVPSDELCDVLKNRRIVINFSNYTDQVKGKLLHNIYATINKLKKNNIPYIFSTSKLWTDWGGFELREKTDEQLKRDFRDCFCSNCHRLFNGIMYRCPHQYAGLALKKMQFIEGEYVEIHRLSNQELADALNKLEAVDFTDGCRRCDMPYDCPIVPAGLQL